MIMTTTNNVAGREITEYKGVFFGEIIAGINFMKDFMASLSNFWGGRSKAYEKELLQAREKVLQELAERAENAGANAVVGVQFDLEVLGDGRNNMLLITVCGTGVRIE